MLPGSVISVDESHPVAAAGRLSAACRLLAASQRESIPYGLEGLRIAIADGPADADSAPVTDSARVPERFDARVVNRDSAPQPACRIPRGLERNGRWTGEDQRWRDDTAADPDPGHLSDVPALHRRARRMGGRLCQSGRAWDRLSAGRACRCPTLQGRRPANRKRRAELADRARHPDRWRPGGAGPAGFGNSGG